VWQSRELNQEELEKIEKNGGVYTEEIYLAHRKEFPLFLSRIAINSNITFIGIDINLILNIHQIIKI